jgi:hypothetical protein
VMASQRTLPYFPTSAKRYNTCSSGAQHDSGNSVDSCEQLLKSVVHAFGIRGRVGQGVAIRSGAD